MYLVWIHLTHIMSFFSATSQLSFIIIAAVFQFRIFLIPKPPYFFCWQISSHWTSGVLCYSSSELVDQYITLMSSKPGSELVDQCVTLSECWIDRIIWKI
ncbi:unnamed protein product [Cuscuta campestris]|uniref:Uncharacterized protein n=1 Tax=Cuscuta campestris TaxID=132261 RepID=A0A484L9I8_9ASTE|nr:unnamed protein product [Cuscuta campestris]